MRKAPAEQFLPDRYNLNKIGKHWQVLITGRKLAPPSKRLTFHQKGLRIKGAKISQQTKQGPLEHEVSRINHLPTFEQVRLHTKSTLFPGRYEITIIYSGPSTIKQPTSDTTWRTLFPSIDEPTAKDQAKLNLDNAQD